MFKNQPKGLYVLALANTGERFGYYTMLAIFLFYLQAKFGLDSAWTGQIMSIFLALVYFMPLIGGVIADKWSFSKCVVTGISVMFVGYVLMSVPTAIRENTSLYILFAALFLISVGTGLFKGNLQVMVGDLYNNAKYAGRREAAFSLFYMAINIGSMFAPTAASYLKDYSLERNGFSTENPMIATVCNWCIDTDDFTVFPAESTEKFKSMNDFAVSEVKKEILDKDDAAAYSGALTTFLSASGLNPENLKTMEDKEYKDVVEKAMALNGNLKIYLSDYLADFTKLCAYKAATPVEFSRAYIDAYAKGCELAFGLACVSLIISFMIYIFGRRTYKHIITDKKAKAADKPTVNEPQLTPGQTKQRIVALLLVFTVVIFFWMVFHQNGQTLTEFAKSCTSSSSGSWTRIGFNLTALTAIAVGIYAVFSIFQSTSKKAKAISSVISAVCVLVLVYIFIDTPETITKIDPIKYQQFNPFYVVALTPFSMLLFSSLAKKGKDPSAPRKIGYGMIVAGLAYLVMVFGSLNLIGTNGNVSTNWLISTYLLLTFAELLLSPMGISFVSKVAPPKYKGMMMGGWFAATAIGNYLVSIPMLLWGNIPVWAVWAILIALCLLSAAFIFSIMKKLEAATSDAPAEPVPDALETIEDDAI